MKPSPALANCSDLHVAKLLADAGQRALLAMNGCDNKYLKEIANSRVREFMRYFDEVNSRLERAKQGTS